MTRYNTIDSVLPGLVLAAQVRIGPTSPKSQMLLTIQPIWIDFVPNWTNLNDLFESMRFETCLPQDLETDLPGWTWDIVVSISDFKKNSIDFGILWYFLLVIIVFMSISVVKLLKLFLRYETTLVKFRLGTLSATRPLVLYMLSIWFTKTGCHCCVKKYNIEFVACYIFLLQICDIFQ